ncbi:MAG: STAS domain-containing protein [Alphaproteobacteria bacterium]
MHMQVDDIDGGVTLVKLDGALDLAGADSIDLRMSTLAESRKRIVLDLEKVTYLASIGLRTLISNARTVKGRGGRLAVFNSPVNVTKVLRTSGVDQIIPLCGTMHDAVTTVATP